MKAIKSFIQKETVLCIAALCALATMLPVPPDREYLHYIDWRVLCLLPIKLIDTAGIRHEGVDFGEIEAEGVRRSEALAKSADVVIDFGGGTCDDERVIAICAKCDLKRGSGLNVSAFTGEGISDLRREIVARLERLADKVGEGAESFAEKNLAALERARAILSEADFSFADAVLLGNVMRRTAATLGEVLGAEYSEDLLDSLFSRFCVGK